jgi:hypothetical protein
MTRPALGGRPLPSSRQRYSRWSGSEVTFGPVGRVVVTVLLFAPVWFGIFYSVFFLVAAAIWMFILPMALHQIWQPVRTCDETAWPLLGPDPTQPTVPAEPAALAPAESLLERSAPSRW